MKQFLMALAAFAALLLASCTAEPVITDEPDQELMVFTASMEGDEADTRTVRQSSGSVFWNPGDQISVFLQAGTGGACFTASNTAPASKADFYGTIEDKNSTASYIAFYPYSPSLSFDGTAFQTTLPDHQEAVADTFADDLFISLGATRRQNITFYHLCGGIKFTVTEPGIKAVTLRGAGDETLAGEVKVTLGSDGKTPTVQSVLSSRVSVVLDAPAGQTLEPGKAYHIVTLPVNFKNGFMLQFEKEDGSIAVRRVSKAFEVQRAHFGVLTDVDKNLSWEADYFEMTPKSFDLTPGSQDFSIWVRSSTEPEVEVLSDWIQLVKTTGDYHMGATYVFRATRNQEEEARTGYITVCDAENCHMVLVTQASGAGMDWRTMDFVHHSMGMRFTATWCQHCPKMNEAFKLVKADLGDKFLYACFYSTSGNYGYAPGSTLETQYQVTGYPSGIVDGRVDIPNYSDYTLTAKAIKDAITETEANYPTVTALELDTALSGDQATVKVNVYVHASDSYKLTVLVLENGIVGNQQDGSTVVHDFEHNKVVRAALTSVSGDAFQGTADAVNEFTYSYTVPDGYVKENLEVIAYVQRPFGSQTVISSADYGGYYVDNCRAVALGSFAEVELQ